MQKEDVDSLLTSMVESLDGVSDLFFVVGRPPQVEAFGKLNPYPANAPGAVLNAEKIGNLAKFIINGTERLQADLDQSGSCDCSYGIEGFARFRVNIFKQSGSPAIVMRKLNAQVPTMDSLGLTPIFRQMVKEKNGIIFVTGATGSGKTTTLAALLNEINEQQAVHVVTLEDPIEFSHKHKAATFCQRELGRDFQSFAGGLRAALRQAPKVILVGEIRDRETMEIALTAAETGHVVFSTLHTINAGQTINRILGMFTKDEEAQVRQRLADTLRYVVSQRLVAKNGGGRVMVNEIMGTNLRVRETVLLGESDARSYSDVMEANYTFGWHTFDQALLDEFEKGTITEEAVIIFATQKGRMSQAVDASKKKRGVTEVDGTALKLRLDPTLPVGQSLRAPHGAVGDPVLVPPPPLPAPRSASLR